MQMFNHGSLFSGIGGFDLAAQWMGWNNVFHCEWNPFGQNVLKYYWPNSISYGDITQTDFTIHRGNIDILTGGFPCQPYSAAGKRKGKEDERHLWPEMLRAICEIQPTWVVGENVSGLVNWNGGMVFDEVQADLETEGYEVIPFLLPACGKNAPHKRERVWFVAYSRLFGQTERQFKPMGIKQFCKERTATNSDRIPTGNEIQTGRDLLTGETFTDTRCSFGENGLYGKEQGWKTTKFGDCYTKFGFWDKFPTTKPTICSRNNGISPELVGITFSKHRNESIKAYGNAIVPQVVFEIFKAIEKFESIKK